MLGTAQAASNKAEVQQEIDRAYKRLYKIEIQLDVNKKLKSSGHAESAALYRDARHRFLEEQGILQSRVMHLRTLATQEAVKSHTTTTRQDLLDAVCERLDKSDAMTTAVAKMVTHGGLHQASVDNCATSAEMWWNMAENHTFSKGRTRSSMTLIQRRPRPKKLRVREGMGGE